MRLERTTLHALPLQRAWIDVQVDGDTTLIPGVPEAHIRIAKVVVTAGGAAVITLKDGTRDPCWALQVATTGHIVLMFASDLPLVLPAGQPFVLHLSAAVRLTGFVEYTHERSRDLPA
jgi:hypothetical protein